MRFVDVTNVENTKRAPFLQKTVKHTIGGYSLLLQLYIYQPNPEFNCSIQ